MFISRQTSAKPLNIVKCLCSMETLMRDLFSNTDVRVVERDPCCHRLCSSVGQKCAKFFGRAHILGLDKNLCRSGYAFTQREAQVFGARLAAVDSETPSALAAGQATSVRARLRYHLCFLLKCQLRGIFVSIFSETHTHTLFLWKTVNT